MVEVAAVDGAAVREDLASQLTNLRTRRTGTWTQRALPHVSGAGKRGQVAVSRDDDLYFVVPDTTTLTILKASKSNDYATYELGWQGKEGAFPPTEPLVDIVRLDYDNVLSVYTRATAADVEGAEAGIDVVVLDFQL